MYIELRTQAYTFCLAIFLIHAQNKKHVNIFLINYIETILQTMSIVKLCIYI